MHIAHIHKLGAIFQGGGRHLKKKSFSKMKYMYCDDS